MKTLDFKTVSPLFEQEKDGTKPFTIHKIDPKDARFRVLSQWRPGYQWLIRITNPASGETFCRRLEGVAYLGAHGWGDGWCAIEEYSWRILSLGEEVKE